MRHLLKYESRSKINKTADVVQFRFNGIRQFSFSNFCWLVVSFFGKNVRASSGIEIQNL